MHWRALGRVSNDQQEPVIVHLSPHRSTISRLPDSIIHLCKTKPFSIGAVPFVCSITNCVSFFHPNSLLRYLAIPFDGPRRPNPRNAVNLSCFQKKTSSNGTGSIFNYFASNTCIDFSQWFVIKLIKRLWIIDFRFEILELRNTLNKNSKTALMRSRDELADMLKLISK